MTERKLTPKQSRFCEEYCKDLNATAAARRAGYSAHTANEKGSQLMALPHVRAEVDRLQAEIAAANAVTVQSLLEEAEEARRMARGKENASGMVAATTLKAKLTGLMVEKTEDIVKRDALQVSMQNHTESLRVHQLMAEAAESLGLPRDATPAELVGASAKRAISTPEFFRLMREVEQAVDDSRLL
jgi:phage terminase small subunit